jgi:hypothetical protein
MCSSKFHPRKTASADAGATSLTASLVAFALPDTSVVAERRERKPGVAMRA